MNTVPRYRMVGPVHAILLAFPVALFTSAVVSDIAYLQTAEIQWSNFSSWLIAGGLFFGALVALLALIHFLRSARRGRTLIYLVLLATMWVIGFVNALLHSRDGWYSVTAMGAFLSVVTALLALIAAWVGYSTLPREEARDARA